MMRISLALSDIPHLLGERCGVLIPCHKKCKRTKQKGVALPTGMNHFAESSNVQSKFLLGEDGRFASVSPFQRGVEG